MNFLFDWFCEVTIAICVRTLEVLLIDINKYYDPLGVAVLPLHVATMAKLFFSVYTQRSFFF